MLFNYTYVPHQMEKMQGFIDFIFDEVWCKATNSGDFEPSLFDGNKDLKDIMEHLVWSDTKSGDFFYGYVDRIYGLFATLSKVQIDQFKTWYHANNSIEQVCKNDPVISIVRYADIKRDFPELHEQLATFFKGLYASDFLKLAIVKEKIGDIDDHYKVFMAENAIGKCPFCGICDVLGVYHTKREAYDHYLPKGLYPFNSINFKNLVPTCHTCNSSYKTIQDPAYTLKDSAGEVHRRKAFYPYSSSGHSIDICMSVNASDIESLVPDDIQLSFGPVDIAEEIDTWKDVYGIEERYKAKCCSASDGRSWLNRVLQESKNYEITVEAMLKGELKAAENQPFADNNFIKKAFLNGCKDADLFIADPNVL
jgi:hypothetical protein